MEWKPNSTPEKNDSLETLISQIREAAFKKGNEDAELMAVDIFKKLRQKYPVSIVHNEVAEALSSADETNVNSIIDQLMRIIGVNKNDKGFLRNLETNLLQASKSYLTQNSES